VKLVLLGTGSADGWPNPFCRCASCEAVRGTPDVRGHTAVLVDGTLLLDCGPDVPRSAARLGLPLDGLRAVLLTHAHPDHTAPSALLYRAWAGRREPLEVFGPPVALDLCAPWIGPGDPVRLRPVAPGDRLSIGPYDVTVYAARHGGAAEGPAVVYGVAAEHAGNMLYATDTGPLPPSTLDALRGADYDVVLLEETFGRRTDYGTDHLDLVTFPAQLAELRRVGAVSERTTVAAVHLGHHNPPPDELAQRLSSWGVVLPRDGDTIDCGERTRGLTPAAPPRPSAARPTAPRRTLVLGGVRSGKSAWAEAELASEPHVTYLATAPERPDDAEWCARVAAHRARRPPAWATLEAPDLAAVLARPTGPLLVDDLGNWLTAVLDDAGAWDGHGAEGVAAAMDRLVEAWRATPARVIAVSNEVGQGVVPLSYSGRRFRDELGQLNARIAAVSDDVVLLTAGLPTRLR